MKYYDGGIPIVNVRLVNEGRIGGEEKVVMPMQAVKLIGREISDLAREAVYVINQNTSLLPELLSQLDKPEQWYDYTYSNPTVSKHETYLVKTIYPDRFRSLSG